MAAAPQRNERADRMNASTPKTRRVLIAGAKFGEMYLNAFLQAQPGLELAGLLAPGSLRAQQLAHAFGIPLYTSVDQVPDGIDIACVVVRSTVVGGTGTALAEAFLRRGVHVVQEHPMHPDDAARLQGVAVDGRGRGGAAVGGWRGGAFRAPDHKPAIALLVTRSAAAGLWCGPRRRQRHGGGHGRRGQGLAPAAAGPGGMPGGAALADLPGPRGPRPAQSGHAPAHAGLAFRLPVAGSEPRAGPLDIGAVRPAPPRQRAEPLPQRGGRRQ